MFEHTESALALIHWELSKAVEKHGSIAARLNMFSDLRWERIYPELFEIEGVTFYDYTKYPERGRTNLPENYKITFSYTGERQREFSPDVNVAVVFDTKRGEPLPVEFMGRPVIDGDATDSRYDDARGVVVGLRAKGKAVKDTTGFVVRGVE